MTTSLDEYYKHCDKSGPFKIDVIYLEEIMKSKEQLAVEVS